MEERQTEQLEPQCGDKGAALTSQSAGRPWLAGLLGVLELFLGVVALASPWIVGASFIWMLGIMLLVLAIVRLAQVFGSRESRKENLIAAVLYVVVGWVLYNSPNLSLAIITLVIGCGLVLAGVFQGCVWVQTRALPAKMWRLVHVLITLVLGVMIVLGWPESSFWVLGVFIAIELIFAGWALLLRAFICGTAKK